ncbi:MAG: DUF4395 domain-containing protein [Coriobacteriia bacterium]|nr:DUF4395 domain-containing protein [Coriobacteriia bacterium]
MSEQTTNTAASADTADANAARIVATLSLVIAGLSFVPLLWWLSVLLTADLVIRGFLNANFSPLALLGNGLASALKLTPRPVTAPPRRFAAQLGTAVMFVASLLRFAELADPAAVATGVFLLPVAVDALTGFSVAGWIYPRLARLRSF